MIARSSSLLVAFALLLCSTSVQARDPDQKCLSSRANYLGKYQYCVEKALGKLYMTTSGPEVLKEALAKCRITYAKAWDKLLLINAAPCTGNRFVDNGSTVTDNLTGLVWEKKTNLDTLPNLGDPQDADNVYDWTAVDADNTDEDGAAFTNFLASLNGSSFGGASGWRLPTLAELNSIVLPEEFPCTTLPCIDAIFGPTVQSGYWSSTTFANSPNDAVLVGFNDGNIPNNNKPDDHNVRAVRSGF